MVSRSDGLHKLAHFRSPYTGLRACGSVNLWFIENRNGSITCLIDVSRGNGGGAWVGHVGGREGGL